MPGRGNWLRVASEVMPTAAADATAVSHSSMPWTSTTGGLVSTGHSSVLVVPVARVDGDRAGGEIGQGEAAAPAERVVVGQGGETLLDSDHRGGEAVVVQRPPEDGDVGVAFQQPDGRRARLHQGQRAGTVVGVPAALDGGGVLAEDRPGEADPQLAVTLLSDPLDAAMSPRTPRASSTTRRPWTVGSAPWLVRSSTRTPSASSRAAIARDTDAWVVPRLIAASVKVPSSTTASSARS